MIAFDRAKKETTYDEPELKLADTMAIDRTRMAAERSLWPGSGRHSPMITFGFTFYKFMQFLQEQSKEPLVRPDRPATWR